MKKKFLVLLLAALILISTIGIVTAFAGSAKVSVSGKSSVVAGKEYTYTYTLKASDVCAANANISVGGVFSIVSGGDNLFYDTIPNNTSGSVKGSVKVRVSGDAKPGDTGTISFSGTCTFVDEAYNQSSGSVSGGITAKVVTQEASNNTTNSDDDTPRATKAPTEWDLAKEKIAAMEEGGTLTIDITGDDRALSPKTYQSLLDKKGIFTFNFGTYSCTLDTSRLDKLGEDVKSIDLGLTLDADPDFSAAVGGNDVYQLHFAHKGEFPGKISFKYKADKNAPGDTVYLYYYYGSSKVIESIQSAVVDADGYVTFDIYHCSSYFVSSAIIEGAAGVVVQPTPEPTPEPSPTVAPTPEPTPEPTEAPAELVEPAMAPASGFPLIVLIAVGGGAALIAVLFTMLAFKVGPFRKRSRHRA